MGLTLADNPARPAAGTELCALADIPEPGARGFDFRQGDLMFAGFVVRRAGQVFGYIDSCPHAGWPLAATPDRYLTREADRLFCSGHGALFRVEDGVCVAGPCAGDALWPWPVAVGADGIIRAA